jgi:hypothetical protein
MREFDLRSGRGAAADWGEDTIDEDGKTARRQDGKTELGF